MSLVVDFLNTLDVEEGTDALAHDASWRTWSQARGLEAGPVETARAARSALRAAVGDTPAASPNPARSRDGSGGPVTVPIGIEIGDDGPVLRTRDAVGAVAAAATRLAVLDAWARVKVCPAHDCRWAFYDESRNRSRTWCSMRVCGNREKARAWRQRRG